MNGAVWFPLGFVVSGPLKLESCLSEEEWVKHKTQVIPSMYTTAHVGPPSLPRVGLGVSVVESGLTLVRVTILLL